MQRASIISIWIRLHQLFIDISIKIHSFMVKIYHNKKYFFKKSL